MLPAIIFRPYSLAGWVRYLKLKVLGRDVIVRGRCRRCGWCCRKLCLDSGGKWIRSVRQFKRLVKASPQYERFRVRGRNSGGYLEFECTLIRENGTCGDYANRPDICRGYPDDELYFTNGILYRYCGYAFEEVPSFKRLLNKRRRSR